MVSTERPSRTLAGVWQANAHARFRIRVTSGPNTGEIWQIETNTPAGRRELFVHDQPEACAVGIHGASSWVKKNSTLRFFVLYRVMRARENCENDKSRNQCLCIPGDRLDLVRLRSANRSE